MASDKKPEDNMLWGGRFSGTYNQRLDINLIMKLLPV